MFKKSIKADLSKWTVLSPLLPEWSMVVFYLNVILYRPSTYSITKVIKLYIFKILNRKSNDFEIKSHDLKRKSQDLEMKSHDLERNSKYFGRKSGDFKRKSHDFERRLLYFSQTYILAISREMYAVYQRKTFWSPLLPEWNRVVLNLDGILYRPSPYSITIVFKM